MKNKYGINEKSKMGLYVAIAAGVMFGINLVYSMYGLGLFNMDTFKEYLNLNGILTIIYNIFLIACNFVGIILFGLLYCKNKPTAVIFCMVPNVIYEIRCVVKYIDYYSEVSKTFDAYGVEISSIASYTMWGPIVTSLLLVVLFSTFVVMVSGYVDIYKKIYRNIFMGIIFLGFAFLIIVHITIYIFMLYSKGVYADSNMINFATRIVQISCLIVILFNLEKKEDKVIENIVANEEESKSYSVEETIDSDIEEESDNEASKEEISDEEEAIDNAKEKLDDEVFAEDKSDDESDKDEL